MLLKRFKQGTGTLHAFIIKLRDVTREGIRKKKRRPYVSQKKIILRKRFLCYFYVI